jgi:tRNA 5-methylaminomethyl-2-thiouridine biosynthesis bifunctional protein
VSPTDGAPLARAATAAAAVAAVPATAVVAAADLPQRWAGAPCFVVLATDFGCGQGFLATWAAWRDDAKRCDKLIYVAVLARPLARADLQKATATVTPAELVAWLLQAWPPATRNLHSIPLEAGRVQLLLAVGDVAVVLPSLRLQADVLLLGDAFNQPSVATGAPRVLKALGRKAALGATLLAQGDSPALHAGLLSAGFEVRVDPDVDADGDGALSPRLTHARFAPRRSKINPKISLKSDLKSELNRAPKAESNNIHFKITRPQRSAASATPTRPCDAVVIGAGLAGAAVAQALAQRGLRVTVLDRHPTPAAETSGNPAGLFHGTVHAADGHYARLYRSAALHAQRWHAAAISRGVAGSAQGLLRMETATADPAEQLRLMLALQQRLGLPSDYVCALSAAQASNLAGIQLSSPAWWYPGGGWLAPPAWVADALAHDRVHFVGGVEVSSLMQEARPDPEGLDADATNKTWVLRDHTGQVLARTALVVLANGAACTRLLAPLGHAPWPLSVTRGQVTFWHPFSTSLATSAGTASVPHGLRLPVTGDGYAIPLPGGGLLCGASRDPATSLDLTNELTSPSAAPRQADDLLNIQRLHRLTGLQAPSDSSSWQARVGWRLQSADSLPIAGALPLPQFNTAQRLDQARLLPRQAGLFVLTALGARGLTWAPLLADLLAAQALGEPWPLEQDLADAVDPARWIVRAARAATKPGGSAWA